MKVLYAVIAFALQSITCQSNRLDINSKDCGIYTEKFGTVNNADGVGASKIAFTGNAAFVGNTSDVEVKLRYSDVDYFNDQKFYGLVQEDGKTPETTCLDMKLYKFPASDYKNGVQVKDLPIKPLNDLQKQWRYYSFTIKGAELSSRMNQTSNSDNYVYTGYYGIAFYAADTEQVQYTFYFEFSVIVQKSTGAALNTTFNQLSLYASAGCTPGGACTIAALSQLQWCTDFTCANFSTPDLHLNDQFVLLQKITTDGMSNFYLTGTEVWYTGNALNRKATITQINNTIKGQIKIQLKVEIAWRNVTIKVNSKLSDTQSGGRRLLSSTTFDTVSAQTEIIECIKASGAETCPNCDEECAANGYAEAGCSSCKSNPPQPQDPGQPRVQTGDEPNNTYASQLVLLSILLVFLI